MDKTFGRLIDEFINSELKPGQYIQSVYFYMEDYQTPKVVLNTAEDDYDYTAILFKVVDLKEQKSQAQKELKTLQDKIRLLEKSKRDVEKAIKLLRGEI